MRKHGGPPSRRDKHVTLAAISPPGEARGRFVGGQQSGLAGCKPPPLFTRGASSCSSQGRRQGEPWGASPRPSAPTYLPSFCWLSVRSRLVSVPSFAVGCFLVVAAPGPLLRLAVSVAAAWCLWLVFFPLFFPSPLVCALVVSGFIWFPALGALGLGTVLGVFFFPSSLPPLGSPCALACFMSPARPLAVHW